MCHSSSTPSAPLEMESTSESSSEFYLANLFDCSSTSARRRIVCFRRDVPPESHVRLSEAIVAPRAAVFGQSGNHWLAAQWHHLPLGRVVGAKISKFLGNSDNVGPLGFLPTSWLILLKNTFRTAFRNKPKGVQSTNQRP